MFVYKIKMQQRILHSFHSTTTITHAFFCYIENIYGVWYSFKTHTYKSSKYNIHFLVVIVVLQSSSLYFNMARITHIFFSPFPSCTQEKSRRALLFKAQPKQVKTRRLNLNSYHAPFSGGRIVHMFSIPLYYTHIYTLFMDTKRTMQLHMPFSQCAWLLTLNTIVMMMMMTMTTLLGYIAKGDYHRKA